MFVPGLLLCKRSENRRVLWVNLFQQIFSLVTIVSCILCVRLFIF